ncbi:MAG: TIGR02171 family protein [Fibrobacter sp.]|nr:TIGR02171 family protein [Fibrobacter sp.]
MRFSTTKRFIPFLAVASLVACSDDSHSASGDSGFNEKNTLKSMVTIAATDSTVFIGTNNPSSKLEERPQMAVKFTYDYSLSEHEVTCGEFKTLMRKEFGSDLGTTNCSGDSLPITSVTFYDAVLFANARSKAEKFDTAYTYTKLSFNDAGNCIRMDGFNFHPDRESYRLPTEAEWMYAASQDWNIDNSWNGSNSDYVAHKVCSKPANKFGLCDMSGNVREWVNDWKSSFKDTTLQNFIGAPDGGSIGERVLKGAYYFQPTEAISIFYRSDVYTVTSVTQNSYIGFRLAHGSIPNPSWLDKKGNSSNSRIVSLVNSATMQNLTGTSKVKLAFRNDMTENLVYIDYKAGATSVHEIQDSLSVYHPEISPDGNKVAFCTMLESVDEPSELYVRDLNENGDHLVKLDVESAAIPRWRVLDNGDTAIVYVSSTMSTEEEAAFKSASTWQVIFKDGKFGTPEKLFDGNYHGGISSDNKLAVSGAPFLRARIATDKDIFQSSAIDTVWYNEEQACNVSLAKDQSKRTLFLDFSGKTGQDFVGSRYKVHERLFIADSNGKIIQSIKALTNYTFDHTEWASSNLVVATLTNKHSAHDKIILIDITDSSITELVDGDELWHPSLWVNTAKLDFETELDLDSAGMYFYSGGSELAMMLRYKMEILWGNRDSKLAIVGSSRSQNGLIPLQMDPSLKAINLSHIPNSIFNSRYIFENYLLNNLKDLKYLVLSLDIDMWWRSKNDSYDYFFGSDYKKYIGYVYDENHNFWKDGYPEGLLELTHESPGFELFESRFMPTLGFDGAEAGGWESEPSVDYDSTWADKGTLYQENFDELETILSLAKKHNITVIGIIFPQSPGYKNTGSFARYGFRRSQANERIQKISDLSKDYPNFILMDEYKMGDHDYTDDMAINKDHLSIKGAEVITHRLDSLISTLE